jgi:hypothetical protein
VCVLGFCEERSATWVPWWYIFLGSIFFGRLGSTFVLPSRQVG